MDNSRISQNKMQVRAACYTRVSTLLGQSVDNQLVPIREYCASRDFELIVEREYSDVGYSGALDRRPNLDRLIKDARSGKFKVLIVAALDRVGRNVKHLLLLLDELHALGITFISLREGIDFGTPVGKMIMTTLAAVAELEREIIRTRIRESLAAKKILAQQQGTSWRCGRPTVATPEVIQEVLALHKTGASARSIERMMNRKVSHSTIAKIIKNAGRKNGP